MASDDMELRAQVSALQSLVVTIAPLIFERAGISADNVRKLAEDLASRYNDIQVENADTEILNRIKATQSEALVSVFGNVADLMAAKAGGDIDIAG